MKISEKSLFITFLGIGQFIILVAVFLFSESVTYIEMSFSSIIIAILDIIMLRMVCKIPIISIPNLFSLFSLFFHMGQIIKEAFYIDGTVPLPFENYAGIDSIQAAFWFYLFSQTIFLLAVGITCTLPISKHRHESIFAKVLDKDAAFIAKILIIIGAFPHIYIDLMALMGAVSMGYEGAYSLYFPQPVRSLAFFFDAGLIILLFGWSHYSKVKWLFIFVIIYKCLMMSSGGRQQNITFLLIWFYAYFFIIQKLTIKKYILLGAMCSLGFFFISAIGTLRTTGAFDLTDILTLLFSGEMSHTLGNALGEFGSAFDTLEVAVQYVPDAINYGYGRTYIAGLISIIPLIVKQIPFLAETTIFLHQLPQSIVFAFGGSYLGELYYNFSWFGVLGSFVLGVVLGKIHNRITGRDYDTLLQKSWAAVLAISMFLFVRGYFTDMVQQLAWTYFAICLISAYIKRKRDRYD